MTKAIVSAMSLGVLLIMTGSAPASVESPPSEATPLGSEYDCSHACNDCQKNCQSIPAGSKQTDCMRACTSTAAGCCAGYGKKPPQGLSCACM